MGQTAATAKLEDRYYLQKVKLGQGSFGTVWRAVDRQSNDIVAIKQLNKAAMPRRGVTRSDTEREIHIMQAAIGQENITRLLGFFEDPESIYLALEYCDGGDFGDKVQERAKDLREDEAAEWMRQIISAIASLHTKSICHRDIKPDNFMVHQGSLRLADFGLALFLQRGRLLSDKCGTPAFMSPEQHLLPRQSRGYNELCDIWAAGITMYMLMFGGKHPFLYGSQLDERRMLAGTLDFNVGQGFLGFAGFAEARYSETAQKFCRRLVEPEVNKRMTSEEAKQDRWLRLGKVVRHPPQAQQSNAQPSSGQPDIPRNVTAPTQGQRPAIQRSGQRAKSQAPQADGRSEAEKTGMQKQIQALQQQVKMHQENEEAQWEMMQQLKLQQPRQVASATPSTAASSNCTDSHAGGATEAAWRQVTIQGPALDVSATPCRLQAGMRCRYNSSSWQGWMPAVVQDFNDIDCTYNLNVRQHAKLENISPAPEVSTGEAWPPGTLVHYQSSTVNVWLPAVIMSYNEAASGSEGTYNMDVRDCAAVDRIRPRCM